MIFAPVLSQVGPALSESDASFEAEPVRWAYGLRAAVDLARPDWIVSHHDLGLEARALRAPGVDIEDAVLAELALTEGVLDVAQTLAALYPGREVAASVTGPATLAARLEGDPLDLLDACADAVAAFAATVADAGATRILVWETEPGGFDAADVLAAHRPLLRRLAMRDVRAVLCHRGGDAPGGYEAIAVPVDPRVFEGATDFDGVLARVDGDLFITDGPIAASCDPAVLRSAGERAVTNYV